jgi:predicted metal-dependent hydrolase
LPAWTAGPPVDPLAYSVRVSARTRRVRLVMTAGGLEVVVPRGYPQRLIPELVESRRVWIEKAAERVAARGRRMGPEPPCLPERISLQAVGEEWVVEYRPAGGGGRLGVSARQTADHRLIVTGDRTDYDGCRQALCRWISRRAREELPPRLCRLARERGFHYDKVSIRQQRTRWGSCSRRGSVSLNARLLLLPAAAADYVLLHELCHTVEMNHSPRFWALVERHDSDFRAHRKLVRTAARNLPPWLDREPGEGDM